MNVFSPHAAQRAQERLGFVPRFKNVMQKIQQGKARLVGVTDQRPVYDVPYKHPHGGDVTVRVLLDETKKYVMTVLPSRWETSDQRLQDKAKLRRKEFFKRFESDEEEFAVTR